jgi:hypothetical protein
VAMMESLFEKFDDKITIPISKVKERRNFKWGIKSLASAFDYQKSFLGSLDKVEERNKVWILKLFILVMVRYNHLLPSEITRIIKEVEECNEDLDIYIYVFWRIATDIWGYNDKDKRFA